MGREEFEDALEFTARFAQLESNFKDAVELLTPFALMASAYEGKPDCGVIAEVNHQSLTISSLRAAKEFVDKHQGIFNE